MLRAAGDVGELYVGYQKVADLAKWNLTCRYYVAGQLDTSFNGKVTAAHESFAHRTPTALWLWMGQAWWVWNRVRLTSGLIVVGDIVELEADGAPIVSETRRV